MRTWVVPLACALAFSVATVEAAPAKQKKAAEKSAKKNKNKRPEPDEITDPKVAFEIAKELSDNEDHQAARPYFVKAYVLSDHKPVSILGLAQCERMLNNYDEAIILYKEYLATKPSPASAEKIQETIALLERLKPEEKKVDLTPAIGAAPEIAPAKKPSPPPAREYTPPISNEPSPTPSISNEPVRETRPAPKQETAPPESIAPAPEVTTAPPIEQEDRSDEAGGSVFSSPVFWAIAGAVVVGGAVAGGLALTSGGELYPGSTGVVARF
jgi:tetratricopeptide (TPR) repeat protein